MWFKNKTYGWGWTPASWQGWVVCLFYTIFIITLLSWANLFARSEEEILWVFLPFTFLATVLLIFTCYKKGEKPRWRWGE